MDRSAASTCVFCGRAIEPGDETAGRPPSVAHASCADAALVDDRHWDAIAAASGETDDAAEPEEPTGEPHAQPSGRAGCLPGLIGALVLAAVLPHRTRGAIAGTPLVRPARPEEYETIGELTVRAYETVDPDLGRYADDLRAVAEHAAHGEVFVAQLGRRTVGTVTYVPGPGPLAEGDDPDAAWIRMLAVDETARGHGIGTALVEACLDRARRDGWARVRLHTTDFMPAAQRLYHRLGFVRTPDFDFEPEQGFWLRGYRFELASER